MVWRGAEAMVGEQSRVNLPASLPLWGVWAELWRRWGGRSRVEASAAPRPHHTGHRTGHHTGSSPTHDVIVVVSPSSPLANDIDPFRYFGNVIIKGGKQAFLMRLV